jgi:hypothetical protein
MPGIGAMNCMNAPKRFIGKPGQQTRKFREQLVAVVDGQQRTPDVELDVGDQRFVDGGGALVVA